MVNIKVRQNDAFSLGYPYNSLVDEYFTSLPKTFIDNYGLDTATINKINAHKNQTVVFDKSIHEFLEKLSAFMVGFEMEGQVIINDYNTIKKEITALNSKLTDITHNLTNTNTELDFIKNNIERIIKDLEKIEELILMYQSQIVDDTFLYNDDFIEENAQRITMINEILTNTQNEYTYYTELLETKIQEFVAVKSKVNQYTYNEITIRDFYESWENRTEEYYVKLKAYFKDEYEKTWTYGKSLMFAKLLDTEEASQKAYKMVGELLQERLFKKYSFELELSLREYSLTWLNNKETFVEFDFTMAVETKRKNLLMMQIQEVEKLIISKRAAVNSVVSPERYNNYFKYIEMVQLRRKYIFMNILNLDNLDNDLLSFYDNQLITLKNDYNYMTQKMSQQSYWNYKNELEMHEELLTDLKRQYDKTNLAISQKFKVANDSMGELRRQLEFYQLEKNKIKSNHEDLKIIRDKFELEYMVLNDEQTILISKTFELEQSLTEKRRIYTTKFTERLPFFTQNIIGNDINGIINLLDGDFYHGFKDELTKIKSFATPYKWYDENSREKLLNLYDYLVESVYTNLKKEWELEFGHEILSERKYEIYTMYLDNNLKSFYGKINKFLLDKVYDENYLSQYNDLISKIKGIFEEYTKIAFELKKDMLIMTDAFDYNNKFLFEISKGIETYENVIETFNDVLDMLVTFGYNKNMEYRVDESKIVNKTKIDQVWKDMEKKYV